MCILSWPYQRREGNGTSRKTCSMQSDLLPSDHHRRELCRILRAYLSNWRRHELIHLSATTYSWDITDYTTVVAFCLRLEPSVCCKKAQRGYSRLEKSMKNVGRNTRRIRTAASNLHCFELCALTLSLTNNTGKQAIPMHPVWA